MPARKMRVEVFDGNGNRYTVTFQGQVTREKALRLLDLVELLGGIPTGNQEWESTTLGLSKFDKIRLITDKYFPIICRSNRLEHANFARIEIKDIRNHAINRKNNFSGALFQQFLGQINFIFF